MTLDDSVHAFRLRLMARARALGNVSQASREFGISRSLFYRWRKRYLTYGPDGLHPRRTGARPGRRADAERANGASYPGFGDHLADLGSAPTGSPAAAARAWPLADGAEHRLPSVAPIRHTDPLGASGAAYPGDQARRARPVWTRSTSVSRRAWGGFGNTPRATRPGRSPWPR
jgi:hypothetical protein